MWSATIATSPNLTPAVFFRSIVRMILIPVCLVPLTSCGYRFAGGEALPQGVESLFIEMLDNKTTEPGVDVVVT